MPVRNEKGQFVKKEDQNQLLSTQLRMFDFDILKRPARNEDGNIIPDVYSLDKIDQNGKLIEPGRCFSFCGPAFKPLKMSIPVDYVESALNKFFSKDQLKGIYLKEYSSFNEQVAKIEIILPNVCEDIQQIGFKSTYNQTQHNTTFNYGIVLENGYGGPKAKPFSFSDFFTDQICDNGLLGRVSTDSNSSKHFDASLLHLLEYELLNFVEQSKINFEDRMEFIRKEVCTDITDVQAIKILSEKFPSSSKGKRDGKQKETIALLNYPEEAINLSRTGLLIFGQFLQECEDRGRSLFALTSALTFWASHEKLIALKETKKDHKEESILKKHLLVREIVSSERYATPEIFA